MNDRQRLQAISGLLCLGILVALIYRITPYLQVHDVQIGDRAPGFELIVANGQGLALGDYEGKWVLVNFWATWCPPCVDEMPALSRLHDKLNDRGLVVVGVSSDEDADAYQSFLTSNGVSFPTVRDPQRDSMIRYGTVKIPESYLIDPQGIVTRKYVNWQDWDSPEINNYLASIL